MDKNEYSIRLEEIKTLIAKKKYVDAAAIADTIDWRRVKKVMTLCTISDLYKINRRLEDARDVLLLAYDRHPGGRFIVYALCELSIKMGSFVEAVEYYKEFVQIAPRDSGRYVLQYKLYEAQEVSLEERIEVLEELKSKDYSEKWAYELAYLYHRVGLGTRCVEECDELILWFGEGKYVQKAMELKQLHAPLTNGQQIKYNQMQGIDVVEEYYPEEVQEEAQSETDWLEAPTKEIPQQELDIQVKLMNVGQYDTINIQKELAQNMKELLSETQEDALQNIGEQSAQAEGTEEESSAEESLETAMEADKKETVPKAEETETIKEEKTVKESEIVQKASQTKEAENPILNAEKRTEGKRSKFDKILGMEYDGQISMLVPDFEKVEKQITGQIRLDDVLVEWEKVKKDSEQKRMEAVRQHVLEQTGAMFTEFEAAARDGFLEKLEDGREAFSEDVGNSDGKEALEDTEAVNEAYAAFDTDEEAGEYGESIEGEELKEEYEESVEDFAEEEPEEEYEESAEDFAEEEPEEEYEESAEDFAEEEPEEEYEESAEDFSEEEPEEPAEEFAGEEASEEEYEEGPAESSKEPPETEIEAAEKAAGMDDETEESSAAGKKEEKGGHDASSKHDGSKVRAMSPEERQHFGHYLQSKATKEQIVHAIDNISMAAYTGNVIITGEEGMDTMTLAKNLIKEVQQTDSNFSGKIAKISGDSLNSKNVAATFKKLVNGALIIQNAGALKKETAERIRKALEQEHSGIIVVLEDLKKDINKLLKRSPALTECFNIRIDIEALDNDSLVAIGKKYARDQEYSIDELGVLALHTCIADRQTSDHAVTVAEVREITDQAIRHANRKTLGHFFDILLAKRYDEEDMIILREKDFI
ncbi:MAG: hypothetical protein K1W13_11395 [Lachnospiraceae bacterium]